MAWLTAEGSCRAKPSAEGHCYSWTLPLQEVRWHLHLRHGVAHELEQRLPQRRRANLLLQQPHPGHHLVVPALPKHARQQAQKRRQPRRIAVRNQRVRRPRPAAAQSIRAAGILACTRPRIA